MEGEGEKGRRGEMSGTGREKRQRGGEGGEIRVEEEEPGRRGEGEKRGEMGKRDRDRDQTQGPGGKKPES